MFLCRDDAPRARRHIEARDQSIRAQAFRDGQADPGGVDKVVQMSDYRRDRR